MPYVIIVNMPGCLPEDDPTAVATLEEAREYAESVAGQSFDGTIAGIGVSADLMNAAHDIPADGGTVGPLPDGYVIDVQPISWAELWQAVRPDPPADSPLPSREQIIDAYNGE